MEKEGLTRELDGTPEADEFDVMATFHVWTSKEFADLRDAVKEGVISYRRGITGGLRWSRRGVELTET